MVDRGSFTNMMNDLTFVDERVRSHAPLDRMTPLSPDWTPGNWDVICGRGKECFEHVGNRRFRVLIDIYLEKYSAAKTKFDKTVIVMNILDTIREGSGEGGFVKQDDNSKLWFEVGDVVAREKIGQQFRTALNQQRAKRRREAMVAKGITETKPSKKQRKQQTRSDTPPSSKESTRNDNSKNNLVFEDSTSGLQLVVPPPLAQTTTTTAAAAAANTSTSEMMPVRTSPARVSITYF